MGGLEPSSLIEVYAYDRIYSLQSHGKALEKECCLPGVFRDSGDTTAIIITLNSRGMKKLRYAI